MCATLPSLLNAYYLEIVDYIGCSNKNIYIFHFLQFRDLTKSPTFNIIINVPFVIANPLV